LDRLESEMHEHAIRILFIAKLTVSFVIPTLIAAGLVRIPWKRWFPSIFAGEMIWTGALVLIGFFTTEAMKRIEQGMGYVILAASVVFVCFLLWLVHRYLTREYQSEVEVPDKNQK
jgi:membrane protein DedA with SNARE-associated domain